MKTIQITMDDGLLQALDDDDEVRRDGRSAVLRRAAFAYLQRKRRASTASAYRRAYARGAPELKSWDREGVWPEE